MSKASKPYYLNHKIESMFKGPTFQRRIQWLIEHQRCWELSSYTIAKLMIDDGLYSKNSIKREVKKTIEKMIAYIKNAQAVRTASSSSSDSSS